MATNFTINVSGRERINASSHNVIYCARHISAHSAYIVHMDAEHNHKYQPCKYYINTL